MKAASYAINLLKWCFWWVLILIQNNFSQTQLTWVRILVFRFDLYDIARDWKSFKAKIDSPNFKFGDLWQLDLVTSGSWNQKIDQKRKISNWCAFGSIGIFLNQSFESQRKASSLTSERLRCFLGWKLQKIPACSSKFRRQKSCKEPKKRTPTYFHPIGWFLPIPKSFTSRNS